MSENKYSSLDHHHSIFNKIRTPIFLRILLILINIFVSYVFLAYIPGNENALGGPAVLLFSWLLFAIKLLSDLAPHVIASNFLAAVLFIILHILYLAGLCVITTLFIRIIKPPMIRKLSSLLVPISIHFFVPVLLIIINREARSSFTNSLLGSLIALGWVISYRTFDWRLALGSKKPAAMTHRV
jgi:hypothetical protein